MTMPVNVIGQHYMVSDILDNDSDKTITLDGKLQSTVIAIRVKYVASATVATRQLIVQFLKADGTIMAEQRAGATQAASETRYYQFGVSMGDMTTFGRTADYLSTPIPPMPLQKGDKVRVFDADGTAVASDDMHVFITCAW